MNINGQQLNQYINKKQLFLLYGTEPFLINDYASQIMNAHGDFTTVRLYIESPDNWSNVLHEATNHSLFHTKQLFDIRFSKETFNDAAIKTLSTLFESNHDDTVIIIRAENLTKTQLQKPWLKVFDAKILTVQAWPLKHQAMMSWVKSKLTQLGLTLSNQGYQLIIDFTEGNMTACAQAIEKLGLLYENVTLSNEMLLECLSLDANIDIFQLVDTCLSQNNKKAIQTIQQLKAQGVEPNLVLWAFTKELRLLSNICFEIEHGNSFSSASNKYRLWQSKKALYQVAIKKKAASFFYHLLTHCRYIDDVIKGISPDSPWLLLEQLALKLSSQQER
jgi:DNA polymerase III subunit delta